MVFQYTIPWSCFRKLFLYFLVHRNITQKEHTIFLLGIQMICSNLLAYFLFDELNKFKLEFINRTFWIQNGLRAIFGYWYMESLSYWTKKWKTYFLPNLQKCTRLLKVEYLHSKIFDLYGILQINSWKDKGSPKTFFAKIVCTHLSVIVINIYICNKMFVVNFLNIIFSISWFGNLRFMLFCIQNKREESIFSAVWILVLQLF